MQNLCLRRLKEVSAAAAPAAGYFHETELETFHQQMELNFFGVLNVVHALYSGMVQLNKGHICLVGSALSSFGAFVSPILRQRDLEVDSSMRCVLLRSGFLWR